MHHLFPRRIAGNFFTTCFLITTFIMGITATLAADPQDPPSTEPTKTTSAAPAPQVQILQQRPDRIVAVLPNRLIVIAQENRASPVVSAQVWVKTGSVYEQEHVGAGLSHFLEHLLASGGTSTRTEQQTHEILGRIGAETNAQTGMDTVRYYINTTAAHAPEAVDLLSDWMQHSLISETQYKRERDVIQREFDMGNGEPSRIFWKLTQQARYREHPARHPTIGYIDEFLAVTREQITDFYHRMYVPNNMVFVVVGDIDKKKIVDQIATLWADSAPKALPDLTLPLEPEITAPRAVTGTADMDKPRLRLAWPGTRLAAPGDYALDVLSVILGQGESSRLVRTVRDEQRLVNSIVAFNDSVHWGEGFFAIDAEVAVPKPTGSTQPADAAQHAVEQVKEAVLKQIERVRLEGVTSDELARAKRQVLARIIYEAQSAEGTAERLATDVIQTGDVDYFQRYSEAIEKITPGDVLNAAAKFLGPGRLITVTLLPQPHGQKLPPLTRPPEEKTTEQPTREKVELDNLALVERMKAALQAPAAAIPPVEVGPIQRFVLSNGLRVLVQRNTLVPAVAIQFFQLGGLLSDQPGLEGLANATASMLPKGTTTRTFEQISQQTDSLGAELQTQCGSNTLLTKALCLGPDWRTMLALVADINLHPTFPESEWSKLRPRLVAAIARQNDTWTGELQTKFRAAYFGNHQWSQSPLGRAEIVETLTSKDLADFYQRRLGAAQSVLVVFGDVDPAEVTKLAENLFADLPKQALEAAQIKAPTAPSTQLIQVQTNKPLAAVQIGLGPVGARNSPDYPAVQVLAQVLGSFPTGWLDQELRGRGPGLVYAVGAGEFTGLVPGYFYLMFNTKPASVPEAISRSMAVIERAKNTQVDAATLERAKAIVLTGEFMSKQTNSDRALEAALNELYGLGVDEPKEFLHAVEQLQPDALQAAAQLYFRNPVTVILTHEPLPDDVLKKAVK